MAEPLLVHLTVSPALIVTDPGEKLEEVALTATVFAEVVAFVAAAFVFAAPFTLADGAVFTELFTRLLVAVFVVVAIFFEHAAPAKRSAAAAMTTRESCLRIVVMLVDRVIHPRASTVSVSLVVPVPYHPLSNTKRDDGRVGKRLSKHGCLLCENVAYCAS